MKLKKGLVIGVYDGDFVGWTTATLEEYMEKANGYERWSMITKDGTRLNRFVGLNSKNRYSLIDKDLDLYVQDNVALKTVATASFEMDYWIEIKGEVVYLHDYDEWCNAIEKNFKINLKEEGII